MPYRPLQAQSPQESTAVSLMAKRGMNLRDMPQILDPEFAQNIENYLVTSEAGLEKRGGKTLMGEFTNSEAINRIRWWKDDHIVTGYGNSLGIYIESLNSVEEVKNDFVNADHSIVKYGEFSFVASSGDPIGRLSHTLDYDGQTGNFTVGEILTGGTSGATATILADADGGTTGTLTLANVVGVFEDNEALTDSATGVAVVNGIAGHTYTSISGAPNAQWLHVVGNRLFAGVGDEVYYSNVADGTYPPFDSWTVSDSATAAGRVSYRNAGRVNRIDNIGNNIVVFAENGIWAFQVNLFDSAGTASKRDDIVFYKLNSGGYASLLTSTGLYYVNSDGLYVITQLGSQDIDYSSNETLRSELLGNKFFDDVDLSNADMIANEGKNMIFITLKKDSSINNLVLAYNTKLGAISKITGWNINCFDKLEGKIYGGEAKAQAKIWNLFEGNADDGEDIWYKFEQEIKTGSLMANNELLGQHFQGKLSPDSMPVISFDTYNSKGDFVKDRLKLQWTSEAFPDIDAGYGTSGYPSGWGSGSVSDNAQQQFAGTRKRIKSFQRLILRIEGHDKSPHTIYWASLALRTKNLLRKNNLTKIN